MGYTGENKNVPVKFKVLHQLKAGYTFVYDKVPALRFGLTRLLNKSFFYRNLLSERLWFLENHSLFNCQKLFQIILSSFQEHIPPI